MLQPGGEDHKSFLGKWWWWVIGLCLVLIACGIGYFAWRRGTGPEPAPKTVLSHVERMELLRRMREAVGWLENEVELDRAANVFSMLCEKVPDERLGWQNLAITRLLAIRTDDPERASETCQAAQTAIEALVERFPSAEAYWLAAQFMLRLTGVDEVDRVTKVMQLLEEARKRDPQNPVYSMAMYEALLAAPIPDNLRRACDALKDAYRLAPQNLHVLAEWLPVQAEQRDLMIRETLQQAEQTMAPLWRSILAGDNLGRDDAVSSLGRNVLELIDQARKAVDQQDWQQVLLLTRQIKNGIGPLIVHRNDISRVLPHPLEFVVHDFSPAFYEYLGPPADVHAPIQFVPPEALSLSDVNGEMRVVDFLVADFDLDRLPDWIVLFHDALAVYQGLENGLPGARIVYVELTEGMRGLVAGDLDNDHLPTRGEPNPAAAPPATDSSKWHQADLDLVVYGKAGLIVLQNRFGPQGRELVPVNQPDIDQPPEEVFACTLVDFDHDADLDLVFAMLQGLKCWSGRGNGQFEDLSRYSILPDSCQVRRLLPVDWDRDVDVDILCADQAAGPALLENRLHGHVTWSLFFPGKQMILSDAVIGDFDGNGSWDIATLADRTLSILWTTTALRGRVQFKDPMAVSDCPFEQLLAADLDNNGFLDLLAWGSEGWRLWRGAPGRQWSDWSILPSTVRPALVRCYDIDRDGDLDLVWLENGSLYWSRNDGGNINHWIQFRLVGQCDNKGCSGHTGIGSLIELRYGNRYQAQTVLSEVTHFGLGDVTEADVARIVWTNGVPQAIVRPSANQYLTETMTLKGSCPYLYTWDGEQFVFVTDCLWAAPLGLQSARGQLAPSRPWEYLKIPGELLRPREGFYEIQITEELWEAAYFDRVELLAIDHPADVEIFSNEKVGPEEIAAFHIYTVRDRRVPRAARDHRGRDVLPWIEQKDDHYLAAWDKRLRQGLTEPHYVELDLGPIEDPQQILLFLTGWIYPTNTSLNVAFSNHPELDGPEFPSIWTPDSQGNWRKVMPYMGFPGGKTKTIVVDISNCFTPGDYRLRIATSAEIYWDEIFFTVNEQPVPVHVSRMAVHDAHLRYRGFSERIPYQDNRPERYIYQQVDRTPRWPPMRGFFTRYGQVTRLVHEQDNQLVVMGAGDELTLRFASPSSPPPGWKRDFFLHCVGWDKDADLNTIFGQTVEPLPYHGMSEYPYDPQLSPRSPDYQRYLKEYQTRQQNPAWFWKAIQYEGPTPWSEHLEIR